MTKVSPIQREDVADVGRFLHEHLNRRISADAWSASLLHEWHPSPPNHGMQLRDGARLVGVFCAIYSEQWIDGRLERFCNPHSWCVLPEYRSQSIGLILPLLKQPGYHFTMYTPNPKVAEVFRGLKFRDLDARLYYFPNLPALASLLRGAFAESDPARILDRLADPQQRRDYEQHRNIPWLRFVVFGRGDDTCLAVYKRETVKRVPCARILHLSHPDALVRHGALLQHHLLLGQGLPLSRIEARFVSTAPAFTLLRKREQPKLVLSRTLRDGQFHDLYSELVALDV